jgi:hypothetical protein
MQRIVTAIGIGVLTLLLVSISPAQQTSTTAVPNLVRYGGALKGAQGGALSSVTVGVTFAIYKEQEGGAPVWLETQNITTDASGNYSVLLGSTTANGLPSDLFSQQEQRWLGAQVQGQAEQARVLLVSVPYAFRAHEAETLGGRSVEDFILAPPRANSSASGEQPSAAGTSATTTNQQGNKPGTKAPAANQGPTNFSGSTSDQIVGVTQIGTGAGVKSSAPTEAVLGTATAASGKGVAVHGTATGTGGVALKGFATAGTGNTIGVSAYVASPTGTVAVLNNGAGGKIISGQNNGVEKFSVDGNGNLNTLGKYQIGSKRVLDIGAAADQNVFLGVGAGTSNVAGSGRANTFSGSQAGLYNTTGAYNTFSGSQAGYSNTTGNYNTFSGFYAGYANTIGSNNTFIGDYAGVNNTWGSYNTFSGYVAGGYNTTGYHNTFSGYQAGYSNTDGYYNTFSGSQAGYANTIGSNNTFIGDYAGVNNTWGSYNTFSGSQAGYSNTTGDHNTFSGFFAGYANTTGGNNTFIGDQAGYSNTDGGANTFIGYQAGYSNTTGSYDIYIGTLGPSSGNESHTIRIGGVAQTAAFIPGIWNTLISRDGTMVLVDSSGQLGTVASSRRFKEQIYDMGESTNALMKLRPVTFLYKPEYDKGPRTLQYGLIAEEVAEVYPDLVAYEPDGKPYTVKYQYLTTMLLNEAQKQYRRAEAEAKLNAAQQKKIKELEQRLSHLERLLGNQVQTVAQGY